MRTFWPSVPHASPRARHAHVHHRSWQCCTTAAMPLHRWLVCSYYSSHITMILPFPQALSHRTISRPYSEPNPGSVDTLRLALLRHTEKTPFIDCFVNEFFCFMTPQIVESRLIHFHIIFDVETLQVQNAPNGTIVSCFHFISTQI